MLIKISANSPVRTSSLQNKYVPEFLRGSYSDYFEQFTQAESTTGLHSWLTATKVYTRKTL